ncbi:conserved hypothetical protein [Ricinus communis]|uniref:Tf2-1-like SH3-like domain-containing protein n=1 Tax=Ricinus communis TaxID=3988 RepID=B9S0V6_RICCO|nr:conserved hypothetical protein [Ricinus communis]
MRKIEKANAKYKVVAEMHRKHKVFDVGDEVIIFLRKERIPIGHSNKFKPKKYGPCKIIKEVNGNAYVADFSNWLNIFKTFNVADLLLFLSDVKLSYEELNSRLSFHQVDRTNEGQCLTELQ